MITAVVTASTCAVLADAAALAADGAETAEAGDSPSVGGKGVLLQAHSRAALRLRPPQRDRRAR